MKKILDIVNWPAPQSNWYYIPWYLMLWRLLFMPIIYIGFACAWVGILCAYGLREANRFWINAS